MSRVRSLVGDLALIGHTLNDAQVMSYTLHSLGDEFKELTAAVGVRDTPISFEDLYDKLLDEELIRNQGLPQDEEVQITAHLTQKRFNHRGRGCRGGHHGGHNYHTHARDNNRGAESSKPNLMQYSRQIPPYRQGMNYSHSHSYSPSWVANAYQGNQSQPNTICQLCDKPGHGAKTFRSRGYPYHPQPQANIVEGDTSHAKNNWVLDSGATHHITSDLQNLSVNSGYVGNEDVIVGNGFEHGGILGNMPE